MQGGHNHTIELPVVFGPVVLRVALLAAVCAVTGFAVMRAFLGEPSRRAVAWLTGCAGGAVLLELLLAGGLDLPEQLVPLLLAALAVPILLATSRKPAAAALTERARLASPVILAGAGGFALVEFARAGLGGGAELWHTGLIMALVGLSWFTLGLPRRKTIRAAAFLVAAVLAAAAIAGAAQTTTSPPNTPVAATR